MLNGLVEKTRRFGVLMKTRNVSIRPALQRDVDPIIGLYYSYTGRELGKERVKDSLLDYPSFVAQQRGTVVAFSYTNKFAPDILELLNIYVEPQYRSRKIGAELLRETEREAQQRYGAIILVNSILYDTAEPKEPATAFYARNGYKILLETRDSKVFGKNLSGGANGRFC